MSKCVTYKEEKGLRGDGVGASGPITKIAVLVMVSSGASHDCEAHKIVHVVPQLATPQFGTPNEDLLKYNSSARRFAGSVLSAVPSQVPSLGLSDCLHVSFAAGSSLHGLPVSARLLSRCSPSSHSTKTNT